ncbi:MotE family protein [Deferrisoma sp.]
MAREVRFLAPAAALLGLVLALGTPVFGQESQEKQEDPQTLQAKARLLQELDRRIEERRQQLAQEEESLEALRRAVDAARQALVEEAGRLEALKREVEAAIARREKAEDERLDQIAKVYGAMKPREAAQALSGLEDDMAVAILERLPGRTVGKIFDLMDKDRVRELTHRLEEGRTPSPSPAKK